jgi:hypothetical protein
LYRGPTAPSKLRKIGFKVMFAEGLKVMRLLRADLNGLLSKEQLANTHIFLNCGGAVCQEPTSTNTYLK